jgi:hypothetical protein
VNITNIRIGWNSKERRNKYPSQLVLVDFVEDSKEFCAWVVFRKDENFATSKICPTKISHGIGEGRTWQDFPVNVIREIETKARAFGRDYARKYDRA